MKVQFKCGITSDPVFDVTEHCVVIKYTGTFKGKPIKPPLYEKYNSKAVLRET